MAVAAACVSVSAAAALASPAARQSGAPAPVSPLSVWNGVYTGAQAARGAARYGQYCEACHGTDLGGNQADEIPALVWDTFMLRWSERTVKDLVDSISRSMPADKPASLSPRVYVDIVAYLLEANKFPSGSAELDRDPARLGNIVIEKAATKQN